MPSIRSAVLLMLCACAAGFAARAAGDPGASARTGAGTGGLRLLPCRLEGPAGIASVAAMCGSLRVPENPALPEGRGLDLFVARIDALSSRAEQPPLFVVAGGPGGAAGEFYASVEPAFARIRRQQDIVIVDQRGTGRSNALSCAIDATTLVDASGDEIAAASRRCLAALAPTANPAMYTTSLAVQDLDRVRQALGYAQIDLYGVSYGTRVVQHYARRFRAHTHAIILDGVVPATRVLGPDIALHAERALGAILERCARDAECVGAFGDPQVHYRAVRATLARQPIAIELPDPRTGRPRALTFGADQLASALRLASYTSEHASLLPLALFEAHTRGNYIPLAAQYLLSTDSVSEQLAFGMHNGVVCAEDVPRFPAVRIDREALERTYLGTTQVDGLVALCRDWPRGPVDADLHAPLKSDVPALLLSGAADPVTPAGDGTIAASGYARAQHIVLQGMGHGQLGAPCVDRIMAAFLAMEGTQPVDTSCVRRIAPAPFFTSKTGPAP